MQMREKVGKSWNTVFFQWFGAPEGRKVGSLKRRVRSQLARWEMKHCTPARSTFASQNVQNTWCSEHFWKLRCRKSARCCGAKHISKSKCTKHFSVGPLLEVEMSKTCTPLWRETHFEVKMYKTHHSRTTFGSSDVEKVHAVVARSIFPSQKCKKLTGTEHFWTFRCAFVAGARDCAPWQKWAKREGFVAFPKTLRWFPERGCILEHQIFRFAEMILRDRRGTSYDLASIFRGRRRTLHRWSKKIAKRIGTSLSALHSTFHFWRTSRRMLRFWWLALRKMRKSRRIASFRMLSSSKNEDVSQNCSVLDVLMFKHYGSLAEFLRFWSCR